jgi:hypothetical protein
MKLGSLFDRLQVSKELTTEFFGVFMRMEYALKQAGFIKRERGGDPDWDRFARDIAARFDAIDNPQFRQAVAYIIQEPPRKQIWTESDEGEGYLEWKNSPPDPNLSAAEQALLMVRRVRNNLFHGIKLWSGGSGERSAGRDQQLIESSLCILTAVVQIDDRMHELFYL